MTWVELVARLRELRVTLETDGTVRFMWLVTVDPPQPQELRIELGEVGAEGWMVMTAPIFGRARMDPERALRRNGGMAIGAIALVDDAYCVRHAVPLATLVWSDLERAIRLIAAEAVRLRCVTAVAEPAARAS
jgi:hypothetical protein